MPLVSWALGKLYNNSEYNELLGGSFLFVYDDV